MDDLGLLTRLNHRKPTSSGFEIDYELSSSYYDKPVYDDEEIELEKNVFDESWDEERMRDQFHHLLGNVGGNGSREIKEEERDDHFDHLLGSKSSSREFEDFIHGGFGGRSSAFLHNRSSLEATQDPQSDGNLKETASNVFENPFLVLEPAFDHAASSSGLFSDPLEERSHLGKWESQISGQSSVSGDVFEDLDPLSGFDSMPVEETQYVQEIVLDMPSVPRESQNPFEQTPSPSPHANSNHASPRSEENVQPSDDIWITVSEIPLFTQPTRAPPPSRPPPPVPRYSSKPAGDSLNSPLYSQTHRPAEPAVSSHPSYLSDEFENFAMGKLQNDVHESFYFHSVESQEKESVQLERDKHPMEGSLEEEFSENQERLDHERRQREREEEEDRERRSIEIERAKEREWKERQAVERANKEARERAAAEARLKAERAAVLRVQAEARERAAIEARAKAKRVAEEARERAAMEAREKEAREKEAIARAEADARRQAERAVVDRLIAEARERAAAEARPAAARKNQQKKDDDFEYFFNMRSQPGSKISSNTRKTSPTNNIADDLSSIFGAAEEFKNVKGENEDRKRVILEREKRTQERAAQALAEKNQRDLQYQREQEERHRIAETIDIEIKRWAAGKEGNLRALLSTLQYVLWPECGWQPVSLTDLITGASVKKIYRKATLCLHPDKVQQKGANIQQKYIAEKVFDIIQEAWKKFNSEELF